MIATDKSASVSEAADSPGIAHAEALRQRAHELIPGGSHTYAKGDDQFPESAPPFIVRGAGCHAWDLDNREFIEYGMGLRAVTLGHGIERVNRAAYRQMQNGINFSRPSTIELEAAEAFLGAVESAEMVKFSKNGSDVTTAAVKLARAVTGRDMVALCADQPFFSTDDWFIATTENNAGIPESIASLSVRFRYNDLASLVELFDLYPERIACVVLEAEAATEPAPDYLAALKELCESRGALLIFDEMITGFRWHLGGAQKFHGVTPHLSTFGKALGNGFAISALAGERRFMRLGGLDHDQPRVFLLSTTHGAETHALAAAIEIIRIYREQNVVDTLWAQGKRLRALVHRSIAEHRLEEFFEINGRPCNLIFATLDENRERSQEYRTLFMQELIRHGVIAPSFVVSFSHSDADIDRTGAAVHEALAVYRRALDEGIGKYLEGRPVKPVNRRFN